MYLKKLTLCLIAVFGFIATADVAQAQPTPAGLQTQTSVTLIEPLGNSNTVPVSGTTIAFVQYFQDSLGWIQIVAVGFCLIWLVVGGIMIMLGMHDEGKSHVTWALIGLAVLAFAGSILKALNSAFFT